MTEEQKFRIKQYIQGFSLARKVNDYTNTHYPPTTIYSQGYRDGVQLNRFTLHIGIKHDI